MGNDNAIEVKNLSKTFKLPHERHSGIKQSFVHLFNTDRGYEAQRVLEEINFEIQKGDFFGIVGRNGSGKSTLLKILAGIYTYDSGSVRINGTLTPFIELGVGFNPELTGKENIFLNGALLGFSRREIAGIYDQIVQFAELEKFMDQKLKNYSSGMQVRLAFSIAIQAKSDILLIDEVLAVGDAAFQQKCFSYFDQIKKEGKTIILVSHDMEAIKRFCTKALMLENGQVLAIGSPNDIANKYVIGNTRSMNESPETAEKPAGPVKNLQAKLVSDIEISSDNNLVFDVNYELTEDIEVDLGISITYSGQSIIEQNTKRIGISGVRGKHRVRYTIPLANFLSKKMGVDVALFRRKDFKPLAFDTNSFWFIVKTEKSGGGLLETQGEWTVYD